MALSPTGPSRVHKLAALVANDDAFGMAFKKTHVEEKAITKSKLGWKQGDHMETLLL